MNKGVCAVAATLLTVAGCSEKAATPPRGVLPPGTAKIAIDGKDVGTTYSVRCQSVDWMTRIHADLKDAGIGAMLSTTDTLTAEFVRFHDLDGFTGSFERTLQGEATVTMTGPTYHITGAALGFNKAQRTQLSAQTFTINVSC